MSENNFFPIRNWSEDDKPREKLMIKGKSVLTDAELLAIIIGSGSRNETAVDLSKKILASVNNNLSALGKLSLQQLMLFKGIGEAKAISIIATLELGRRRRNESPLELTKIISSKIIFEIMQPLIGELQHEEFWIIYLNNANKILFKTQLWKGSITGTMVDVRLVFKGALETNATSIVLCHNHPSGTLLASEQDKLITKKLQSAGNNLDIKIIDHVIICEHGYFSFADEGIL